MATKGIQLTIDPASFELLLERVVERVLARTEADRARLGDKICYPEEAAAQLLGLKKEQLAAARREGRICGSKVWGRRVCYTQEELLRYLRDNPWEQSG